MEKGENYMLSHICGTENKMRYINKQKPGLDTDSRLVVTRRKGGWGEKKRLKGWNRQ